MPPRSVLSKTVLFAKMKPFVLRNASYRENRNPKGNEIGHRVASMGLGGMDTMLGKRNCRVGSCGRAAITSLDRQALCLNHFLLRCYDRLAGLRPPGRKGSIGARHRASSRAF